MGYVTVSSSFHIIKETADRGVGFRNFHVSIPNDLSLSFFLENFLRSHLLLLDVSLVFLDKR